MLDIEQALEHSDYPSWFVRNLKQHEGYCWRGELFSRETQSYYDLYFHFDIRTGRMWDYVDYPADNVTRLRPRAKIGSVTKYQVFGGARDWPKSKWRCIDGKLHADGATAAELVKHHNEAASKTDSPFRFMVKRHVEELPVYDYHAWAEFRFSTGEYEPLPWADEPWVNKDHCAHQSKTDPELIAYFSSPAEGQRDRLSTISAGRYLTAFYSDKLSAAEIQEWVTKFEGTVELEFTESTPEAIIAAYTTPGGPSSCMSHSKSDYSSRCSIHPVGVYGAGDLSVALLKRKNKVSARALCWPEKKVVGRIYGDYDRMNNALAAAGYSRDASGNGSEATGRGGFDGARILKFPISDNYFVMPYLDFGYGIKNSADGEHFEMSIDKAKCWPRNTNGTVSYPSGGSLGEDDDDDDYYDACEERECDSHCHRYCDDCTEWTSYGDMSWVEDGEVCVCDSCYSRRIACDSCSERVRTLTDLHDANHPDLVNLEVCSACLGDPEVAAVIDGVSLDRTTLTEDEEGNLVPSAPIMEAAE